MIKDINWLMSAEKAKVSADSVAMVFDEGKCGENCLWRGESLYGGKEK